MTKGSTDHTEVKDRVFLYKSFFSHGWLLFLKLTKRHIYTIAMSKRILLTGANGFVGSWVLDRLLKQGHSVRAIIRSESKAQQISSDFPKYKTQLDFGIVPDITTPGAFDEVVKSHPPFDIVIHTASPFLYKVITDNREFLNPAIRGTMGVLESVKKNASGVRRVVVTSSCAAIVDFAGPYVSIPQKIYTEGDWNPTTWESALHGTQNNAYQASKKFAELAGMLPSLLSWNGMDLYEIHV